MVGKTGKCPKIQADVLPDGNQHSDYGFNGRIG